MSHGNLIFFYCNKFQLIRRRRSMHQRCRLLRRCCRSVVCPPARLSHSCTLQSR